MAAPTPLVSWSAVTGLGLPINADFYQLVVRYCSDLLLANTRDSFGVFCTVRRDPPLLDWPFDIHGCIGEWEHQYRPRDPATLVDSMASCSRSAFYTDTRRSYFPTSVEREPEATVEVTLMMLPVMNIDPRTGRITSGDSGVSSSTYDAQEQGLIVQSHDYESATYLPRVFPAGISWRALSRSLLQKAGIDHQETSVEFLAYNTIDQESSLFSAMFGRDYVRSVFIEPFVQFVNDHTGPGGLPPFAVTKDGSIIHDANETTRNAAVSLYASTDPPVSPYVVAYGRRDPGSRQAIATLLLTCQGGFSLVRNLLNDAQTLPLEPEFERWQVLQALVRRGSDDVAAEARHMAHLWLEEPTRRPGIDGVFEANWRAQYMAAETHRYGGERLLNISQQAIMRLVQTASGIIAREDHVETNYLAVAFEGLAATITSLDLTEQEQRAAAGSLMGLLFVLVRRYDVQTGLFTFLDGTARADITAHVMHGLRLLAYGPGVDTCEDKEGLEVTEDADDKQD